MNHDNKGSIEGFPTNQLIYQVKILLYCQFLKINFSQIFFLIFLKDLIFSFSFIGQTGNKKNQEIFLN